MYAAMLLNKAGTDIDEKSLTKVLEAAGVKVDKAKVTVVVNALKGVDVEKVLKESTAAPVTAAPAAAPASSGEAPASARGGGLRAKSAAGHGLHPPYGDGWARKVWRKAASAAVRGESTRP